MVFRLSFVDSRSQGRQLVTHGHFNVNGKKMTIPSYLVKPEDVITWKASGDTKPEFIEILTEGIPKRPIPQWLNLDPENLTGKVVSLPNISEIDSGIDSRLIVEFYSR